VAADSRLPNKLTNKQDSPDFAVLSDIEGYRIEEKAILATAQWNGKNVVYKCFYDSLTMMKEVSIAEVIVLQDTLNYKLIVVFLANNERRQKDHK
jgi:hypothetical protein